MQYPWLNFASRPLRNYHLHSMLFRMAFLGLAGLTFLHGLYAYGAWNARGDAKERMEAEKEYGEKFRREAAVVENRLRDGNTAELRARTAWANGLIEAQRFSWTRLLDDLEGVLLPRVYVRAVMPTVQRDGSISLKLAAIAKTPSDLAEFLDKLEASPIFSHAYSSNEKEDLLKTVGFGVSSDIDVLYQPLSPEDSKPPAAQAKKEPRS